MSLYADGNNQWLDSLTFAYTQATWTDHTSMTLIMYVLSERRPTDGHLSAIHPQYMHPLKCHRRRAHSSNAFSNVAMQAMSQIMHWHRSWFHRIAHEVVSSYGLSSMHWFVLMHTHLWIIKLCYSWAPQWPTAYTWHICHVYDITRIIKMMVF